LQASASENSQALYSIRAIQWYLASIWDEGST
jgi:hypothetical protein